MSVIEISRDEINGRFNRLEVLLGQYLGEDIKFGKVVYTLMPNGKKIPSESLPHHWPAELIDLAEDLSVLKEVRNHLTHRSGLIESSLILPTQRTLEALDRLIQWFENRVLLSSMSQHVTIFESNEPMTEILDRVKEESFSQFPIYWRGAFKGLLTSWGIALALARGLPLETTCGDALQLQEENRAKYDEGEFAKFMQASDSLLQASRAFEENIDLQALLFTETGDKSEPLLGMLTSWDIRKAKKEGKLPSASLKW